MSDLRSAARLSLLVLGLLCLVGGVFAGLSRLAFEVPGAAASGWHAALMISAFFGTVTSLERAVALGSSWAYLAPASAGLAGITLLAGAPPALAQILMTVAAATLLAGSAQVLRRLAAPFTIVLAIAALCWLFGNLAWLATSAVTVAVPWWLAFLVLIIAAERLELTRFLPTPVAAQRLFFAIISAIVAGALASFWFESTGLRLFGAGLLALASWLMRYDIARLNAHQRGLTRFIAICLLSGYGWLFFAGLLGLAGGFLPGHPWRDAALHGIGLGFIFSMVFGHAPIIVPALTRVKIPYSPAFYLPLLALHASLAVRVTGGLIGDFALRREGGLANACALFIFVAAMLTGAVLSRRKRGAENRT